MIKRLLAWLGFVDSNEGHQVIAQMDEVADSAVATTLASLENHRRRAAYELYPGEPFFAEMVAKHGDPQRADRPRFKSTRPAVEI